MSSAAIQILLTILMSLGITFTTANIGESVGDALESASPETKAQIERYLANPRGSLMWDAFLGMTLTADMISSMSEAPVIPTSALAESGIDVSAWLGANIHNINKISQFDNGCMQLSDGGKLIVEIESQYDEAFKYDDMHYTFFHISRYTATGDYVSKITLYEDITLDGLSYSSMIKCWSTWGTCDGVLGYEAVDTDTNTYVIRLRWWSNDLQGFYVQQLYFRPDSPITGAGTTEIEQDIGSITTDAGTFPLNPDGSVTIDGTTYYPNADGTYTIGDNTYTPSIDLSAYNDAALIDLLNQILSLMGTETTGEYNGLLSSIISNLGAIRTAITTGTSSVIDEIKTIPTSVYNTFAVDLTLAEPVIDDSVDLLKERVGYDAILENINTVSTGLFGRRTFNDDGTITIQPVFNSGKAETVNRPHLYFTLWGKQYDVFYYLYLFDDVVVIVKAIVSTLIIIKVMVAFFRSIPNILMSAGGLDASSVAYWKAELNPNVIK